MLHRADVEERRRVARNEDPRRKRAAGSDACRTLSHRQAAPVTRREFRQVARRARDVAVAAEDLVEGECTAELGQRRPNVRCSLERYHSAPRGELSHERRRRRARRRRWRSWLVSRRGRLRRRILLFVCAIHERCNHEGRRCIRLPSHPAHIASLRWPYRKRDYPDQSRRMGRYLSDRTNGQEADRRVRIGCLRPARGH